MFASRLNVYGKKVLVECFDSSIKTDLDHDFSYFLTDPFDRKDTEFFHVSVLPEKRRPLLWLPLFKTKRSVLYAAPLNKRRVCFFDSAWLEYSFDELKCTIYSDNAISAYEAVYFVLLSYLGEHLAMSGMHRIHGMGFTFKGRGVILLAPSGGGKSTLALELLKNEEFRLLSDDTPVLDNTGKMLAFPQRIALKEKPDLENQYLRKFKRFDHGEKYVVGAEYFGPKIAGNSEVEWLMVLDSEGEDRAPYEVSRLKFIWPVIKWLVIGYETPQIWELMLRPGRQEIKKQAKILFGRMQTALRLVAGSRVAVLKRGATPEETAQSLSRFLTKEENLSSSVDGPTKN